MQPRLIAKGIPDLFPMERSGAAQSHISYVINDLSLKLGHYKLRDDSERPVNLMSVGQLFEDAVRRSLQLRYAHIDPARYIIPGELTKDGLIGNPDLFDCIDVAMHEIKLTNKSSRHDIESDKFWAYWVQLMCYCYMAGVNLGRLHICFLRGDYHDIEMDYMVWEDTFTPNELFTNWRMVVTHAATLRQAS